MAKACSLDTMTNNVTAISFLFQGKLSEELIAKAQKEFSAKVSCSRYITIDIVYAN